MAWGSRSSIGNSYLAKGTRCYHAPPGPTAAPIKDIDAAIDKRHRHVYTHMHYVLRHTYTHIKYIVPRASRQLIIVAFLEQLAAFYCYQGNRLPNRAISTTKLGNDLLGRYITPSTNYYALAAMLVRTEKSVWVVSFLLCTHCNRGRFNTFQF